MRSRSVDFSRFERIVAAKAFIFGLAQGLSLGATISALIIAITEGQRLILLCMARGRLTGPAGLGCAAYRTAGWEIAGPTIRNSIRDCHSERPVTVKVLASRVCRLRHSKHLFGSLLAFTGPLSPKVILISGPREVTITRVAASRRLLAICRRGKKATSMATAIRVLRGAVAGEKHSTLSQTALKSRARVSFIVPAGEANWRTGSLISGEVASRGR